MTADREIAALRSQIDELDRQLVDLFGRRRRLSSEVIRRKREAGLPVRDPRREAEMRARADSSCLDGGRFVQAVVDLCVGDGG